MGKGLGDMSCRHKAVLVFGLIQVQSHPGVPRTGEDLGLEAVMGAAGLGLGYLVVKEKSVVAGSYHGIWGGAWILVTGILGIVGGLKRSRVRLTFSPPGANCE